MRWAPRTRRDRRRGRLPAGASRGWPGGGERQAAVWHVRRYVPRRRAAVVVVVWTLAIVGRSSAAALQQRRPENEQRQAAEREQLVGLGHQASGRQQHQ